MDTKNKNSFFSVAFETISLDKKIDFDLYINSSTLKAKEKFIRIFPLGDVIEQSDLGVFKKKYHQIYIREEQRSLYLRSLCKNAHCPPEQKTEVIKDSAIHYLDKLFDPQKEFTTELLVETVEGCREAVESMVDVIQDYNVNQIQELIGKLSFHDFYTYDHSINVAMYCINLFKTHKPDASKEEIVQVGLGGMLHDIGKLKIPTHIINNPDKLSDDEFEIVKTHPAAGEKLLETQSCPGVDLKVISHIVSEHHENYNGTGYPKHLKGEEIHLLARITAIADFFDALTTKRSYHEVVTIDEALEIMSHSVGKKIDPELFTLFQKNASKVVKGRFAARALPDDFDPCQPQNVLPFKKIEPQYMKENIIGQKQKDFGKIKAVEDIFGKKKKAS